MFLYKYTTNIYNINSSQKSKNKNIVNYIIYKHFTFVFNKLSLKNMLIFYCLGY